MDFTERRIQLQCLPGMELRFLAGHVGGLRAPEHAFEVHQGQDVYAGKLQALVELVDILWLTVMPVPR